MKKTLTVYANPSFCVDHEGRPCCAVATDPTEHISGRWVGASLKIRVVEPAKTRAIGTLVAQFSQAVEDVEWEFSTEPQVLPDTSYYRERIREGSLLPADAETAARCRVKFEAVKPGDAGQKERK